MKVVLDIETVQATRDEWAGLVGKVTTNSESSQTWEGYDLFAAGAAEEQRRAEDESYAKSAFDGTFSRIVCIGLLEFSDQSCSANFGRDWPRIVPPYSSRITGSVLIFPSSRSGRSLIK
jgi:hypothetical protein